LLKYRGKVALGGVTKNSFRNREEADKKERKMKFRQKNQGQGRCTTARPEGGSMGETFLGRRSQGGEMGSRPES